MATSSISVGALALRDVYTELPSSNLLSPPRTLFVWGFRRGRCDALRSRQLQQTHSEDTRTVNPKMTGERLAQLDLLGG